MYLLAPAVLCVGLSFALYGTTELWRLDVYKMQSKDIPPLVALDVVELKHGIKTKQISKEKAEQLFQQKFLMFLENCIHNRMYSAAKGWS